MKVAAIWARVSSEGQQDLSLDGQVERVKTKLEAMECVSEHVFKVVWTSTDLRPCPEFQKLQKLIQTRQIQVIGMLDRDRIEANGLQRLNFLADCKDNQVEPVVYQGVPFLDGAEGQLVELALALAKQKQVERASGGAKQGLSDRVRLKGLPATTKKPYGYVWSGSKFAPDENYANATLIWELALSGMRLGSICRELCLRGIATPTGKTFWQLSSLGAILGNPVYAGRIGALRYEKVDPKKRKRNTFGKTSFRTKPIEEWHFLDGLVDSPVISWEQFLAMQERLKLNRLYAKRNAHHDFLLRGLIQCQECYARGEDRHYFGLGRDKVYVCSGMRRHSLGRRCPSKTIPCQKIEDNVKARVRDFLDNPDAWHKEVSARLGTDSIPSIEQQVRDNERQRDRTIVDERQAFKQLTPEAFAQEQTLIKAKRTWLEEENRRLQAALINLRKYDLTKAAMEHMSERLRANLEAATNKEWRFILEALGTKVLAFGNGNWDVEINIPVSDADKMRDPIKDKTACASEL